MYADDQNSAHIRDPRFANVLSRTTLFPILNVATFHQRSERGLVDVVEAPVLRGRIPRLTCYKYAWYSDQSRNGGTSTC